MKCYRVIAQIERMKTGRPGDKLKIANRYCAEKPYYDIIIGDEGLIGWGHRDAEKVLRLERR
jgi:hypothetical protein